MREVLSRLNRGQGLVKGKCGTAEEADLLATDEGDSAVREALKIFLGLLAAAVEEILCTQNAGDLAAAFGGELQVLGVAGGGLSAPGRAHRRIRTLEKFSM